MDADTLTRLSTNAINHTETIQIGLKNIQPLASLRQGWDNVARAGDAHKERVQHVFDAHGRPEAYNDEQLQALCNRRTSEDLTQWAQQLEAEASQ